MHIIHLDQAAITEGKHELNNYAAALLCGPSSDMYVPNMTRYGGPSMIVGAVIACIGRGLNTRDMIINAVSRATRCRRSTVTSVLDTLAGDDPKRHYWRQANGRYYSLRSADQGEPGLLIAA